MRGHFFAVAAIAFTALNLSGCGDSPSPSTPSTSTSPMPPSELNIVEALQASELLNFGAFVAHLTDANLVDLLSGHGPWTVLAFYGTDPVQDMDPVPTGDALADLMKYHVVRGKHVVRGNQPLSRLTDGESLGTLFGNHSISATVTPQCIGDCWTFASDSDTKACAGPPDAMGCTCQGLCWVQLLNSIECSNGVIYAVKGVLVPDGLPPNSAQATADVSDLVTQMAI